MFIPAYHAETDLSILRQFIRDNPLGIFTTATPSTPHSLLQVSHIPWVLDFEDVDDPTNLGRLRGHMARQNVQAKAMIQNLSKSLSETTSYLEEEVLIVFNGPVHHYITPKYYVQTKPDTGKVVPTWNYSTVQVYGKARVFYDTKSADFVSFLSKQLSDLTRLGESSIMGYGGAGRLKPWEISDAPDQYIDLMTKSLIGLEVEILSMTGKFKWSQEKPKADRDGVIAGLQNLGSAAGSQMATIAKERAAIFDSRKVEKKRASD
ncbi:negative transcriptional regulator [Penicillium malachiteum]|uniref:Negative transcriptional regulator n=1 Tax=Penicillium malachiteum TaxID=1324776 RepID=A0AAD6HXV0_9EURO|nr:negative transcriptional regulator [Penicillium malachiteum]